MPSSVLNVSVDCADPYQLLQFWSEVTGIPIPEEDQPGNDEVGFQLNDDTALLFLRVPEPKTVKNRLHIDIRVAGDGSPEQRWARITAAVDKLTAAGGTILREYAGHHMTMADPEGNEFDVC